MQKNMVWQGGTHKDRPPFFWSQMLVGETNAKLLSTRLANRTDNPRPGATDVHAEVAASVTLGRLATIETVV